MRAPPLPTSLLEAVPELGGATWAALPGLTSGAWRATAAGGTAFAVRRAEPLEEAASACAAAMRVGPEVRAAVGGWLVTELLDGTHVGVLELSRPPVIEEVAALLHRWHRASLELPARSLVEARETYRRQALDADPALVRALAPMIADADRRERELLRRPAAAVTGHLDVTANLLRTPQGLRLIDFEFAASTDPNRELGQLVWEAELSARSANRLVDAYWRPVDVGPRHHADVADWTFVVGVTWTLWGAGQSGLRLWTRRSAERLRGHWAVARQHDTP